MSYFDYVDWQEMANQAMTKAVQKTLELTMAVTIPIEDAAAATSILYKNYHDEIWLIGPVPMKPGYEPPVFDADFLKDIPPTNR